MRMKHLAAALAAVAVLALARPGEAGDTIKLKLPAKPASDLHDLKATEADLLTETIDMRRAYGAWGGHRGWGGGGRGVWVGGRGWGWGGRGVRAGVWGGGWGWGGRGVWVGGWNRGWGGAWGGGWGGAWGGGWGGGWGGARVFYSRPFAFSSFPSACGYSYFTPGCFTPVYTFPCSLDAVTAPSTLTVRVGPSYSARPTSPASPMLPPSLDRAPGTFPYDGGPAAPVPMPRGEEGRPAEPLNRPAITDEILVSTAPQDVSGSGQWAYPAYGETPRRKTPTASSGIQVGVYGRPAN